MKYILIIFCMTATLTNFAQVFEDVCITSGEPTLKSATLGFIDIANEPIKHVRVNFIFLRKDDGTGGFQENDGLHQQYINDLITNLNNIYSDIPSTYDPTCYNGNYGVYNDSKIRFDVNTVYLNDSTNWNNYNKPICPDFSNYHLESLNNQIVQNSSEPAINVFFTEDELAFNNIVENQNCPWPQGFSSVSCSQYPDHNNFNFNQSVHMRNHFLKLYWMMNCVVGNNVNNPEWVNDPPTEEEVYGWLNVGRGIAHELVHSFGYGHVSYNDCDHCLDHLMNNTSCAWGYFISPEIIGYMHHALSHTSTRKYVPAETYSNTPISVSQNKIWDTDMRIYRGVNVNSGAELQILNNVIIPTETGITVTGSSSMIIENSNISTPHTNSTLAINFNQNSAIEITNSTITNCDITVTSSNLTMDGSIIDLGTNGEFVVNSGSEFIMTNSTIQ